MSWNYRVMKHRKIMKDGTAEEWLAIHEVHYRSKEVDDLTVPVDEIGWSGEPTTVIGDDIADLRSVLEMMLKALDKPIIDVGLE